MGYEYLDHEADMGILAWDIELNSAFCEGAKAMFEVMVNLEGVEPKSRVEIECSAFDIAGLFVEWLNELLTQKDIRDMFFSEFEIENITKENNGFTLRGFAIGEPINSEKHRIKTEVKGATYSGLFYKQEDNKHKLQCIIDL